MATLRGPNATESRPIRDSQPKTMSTFLQRLTPHRRSTSSNTGSSFPRSSSSLSSSSSSPLIKLSKSRLSASFRPRKLVMGGNSATTKAASSSNTMTWLETECPPDLLPKIMAYMGPQMMSTMSRVNLHWKNVLDQEATWRALCEELYKWKLGDEEPTSWKNFYIKNPCVPIDYPTIHMAIARVGQVKRGDQPSKSLRVFIRPGRYILKEAISIHTVTPDVVVELETMELPETFQLASETHEYVDQVAPSVPSRRRSSKIRQMLTCRTTEGVVDDTAHDDHSAMDFPDPALSVSSIANDAAGTPKRATLMLRSRRSNEPLVRVRQGTFSLKNVDLYHISTGIDIWNGNAAVQVQPLLGPDDQPLAASRPRAILDQVDVTSLSGRGIVNIDGGDISIRNCYVHDCAATGIYVGGPGSRADIIKTDVVKNGFGNRYHRRGIARGHSGIYLEQGHAKIADCNVSRNSLTGISAVSPENAILTLSDTDLISNGSFQLEMPAIGTTARRASLTENNNLAAVGMARSRSGLVVQNDDEEEE